MFKWVLYTKQFLDFHNVHHGTRKTIEKWQTSRLTPLVVYLSKNIPLYKNVLNASGIDPYSIRNLQDIVRLPVLSKFDFIGKNINEYTDVHHPIKGSWTTTSGSTGVPFAPLRRSIANLRFYGDSIRYRFLIDKQWWRLTINWARVAHIRIFPVRRKNHLVVPLTNLLNDPEVALAQLQEFAPDIVESYPSVILKFIELITVRNIPFHVRYVVTSGEALTPLVRKQIESSLRCTLFDRYGLEEFGIVAYECDAHEGYHVNVESFLVEILDDDGRVLSENQSGRIVVTDLYNHQMPLVRYDTGDHGRVSWERCACGLEAMRIWPEGRRSAVITLSIHNRKYHHFEFSESLKTFMGHIMQFQIEKNSDASIIARIVPGPPFSDSIESSVIEKLSELVGKDVAVSVEKVSSIRKMSNGKIQVVLDTTAATNGSR